MTLRTARPLRANAVALLMAAGTAVHAGEAPLPGAWSIETGRDAATYRNVAFLHQVSAEPIDDEYATKTVSPRLELRCEPGSPDAVSVRIDWMRFISSFNTDIRFAADDAEALTVSFGVDRSNKITSTREASDDERLIDYFEGREALNVRVTPYSGSPLSIAYDLGGFDEALTQLRAACSE